MGLSFRDDDAAQMRRVQRAIIQAVLPFKANTEAALVVFALARCARTMLRLYPEKTQKWMRTLLIAFLEGKTEQPKLTDSVDGASRILTIN